MKYSKIISDKLSKMDFFQRRNFIHYTIQKTGEEPRYQLCNASFASAHEKYATYAHEKYTISSFENEKDINCIFKFPAINIKGIHVYGVTLTERDLLRMINLMVFQ